MGLAEVEKKRESWVKLKPTARKKEMREELLPVVKGPHGGLYILDHRHAALALLPEDAQSAQVGLERGFEAVPKRLQGLRDDPYRSFSGKVRDEVGLAKPDEPFQEFL